MKAIKGIALMMVAVFALGSLVFIPNVGKADSNVSGTWIMLQGFITKWGDSDTFGFLRVMAKTMNINGTMNQWALVHAMWSPEQARMNVTTDVAGTFTFSYYTAKLVNTSIVALNYSGYDVYISGLWNVTKFTTTITINETSALVNFTRTKEPVVSLAPGDLHVNGMQFGLDITGIDPLAGLVRLEIIRYMDIKFFDVTGDGKVDIADLVRVAKAYGAVTGMRSYNFNMDFDLEGKIGIGDLTTIAANIKG